jgi:hypothetical protein
MSRSPYKGGGPKYARAEDVVCVGNGIDALEVWMHVRFREEFVRALADAKARTERTRRATEIEMGGELWRLEPGIGRHRGQPFSFGLTNGRVWLGISQPRPSSPTRVLAKCECRALWEAGPQEQGARLLWSEVARCLSREGVIRSPSVMKVAVTADFIGWRPKETDWDAFVGRAVACRNSPFRMARTFTGFEFGSKTTTHARIYDKTKEIRRSKKTWFFPIWKEVGRADTVWRVEFEFEKVGLRSVLGTAKPDEVLASAGRLWLHSTGGSSANDGWLRLARRSRDTNRNRWKTTAVWEAIRRVRWRGMEPRQAPFQPRGRRLIPATELPTFCALLERLVLAASGSRPETVADGLQIISPYVEEYYRRRDGLAEALRVRAIGLGMPLLSTKRSSEPLPSRPSRVPSARRATSAARSRKRPSTDSAAAFAPDGAVS